MKIKAIRPVMVMVLLLLLVSPAASQVPDDKLITPGVGIGRWTLQMTLAQLVQMNGPANSSRGGGLDSNRPEYWTHQWERLGLVATATGGLGAQTVDVLIVFIQDYKTAKGVSVPLPRDAVEAAYGKPTAVTRVNNAEVRLIYDEIGLWVRILDSTGAATSMGVFRPGAAKQLWKLASSAASQVPDDKLIVPGQRIGRWTLTMTIADLTQMNGAPNQVVPGGGQDRNREVLMHVWDRLGFVAVTNTSDRQRPEVLAATSDEFKTERGIGVNSRRDTVEAAYPRPTAETSVRDEVRRLIYDEIGLGVLTFVSGGLVQSVLVFRPGTAKQLWKY